MLNIAEAKYASSLPSKSEAGKIPFPCNTARHWTLPNGLVVIVKEDHSAPVASVQAWCETGSITEDKQLGAGLSHILEHMLFKGTATRQTNEIAQAVQDAGGYINAYTSFDRTVYWIDIPSKGTATAIDILSDVMMNSTLPPDEYVKEQEVIRREFAMGYDDPDRMSSQMLFATAFREHPYRIPVIGHLDIYNKLTRDDVMAYYKARYVPNNMFFVIVGDVNAEAVYAQIEEYFTKYPRQPLAPVYIPKEPPQLGRRDESKEFPTELTRLEMAWHIPEVTSPDVPALDLLSVILGDGRSSRLYRRIREEKNLAHAVHAWCYTPGHPGIFGVDATLDPEKREAAEAEIQAIIQELCEKGVTAEEIAKAKKQTLSGHLSSLTTTRGQAADLGSNWMLTRNLNFTHDYLAAIQGVTEADISRVLHTYFQASNLTVTSLNPIGSSKKEGEAAKAVNASEVQKFELSNGLRLLVREDARLPLVSIVASFKAGLLAETPETNGITKLFSRTVLKGTKTRSAEQIADEIESIGGAIGSDAGNNSFSVSAKVMQPDLAKALEILGDVLQNPTFPEKSIAREKEAQIASIKAEDEEMTTVARNLMRRTLFSNHPYGLRGNGTPESVSNLVQQQLIDFRNRFVVGKNGVIAVFGNVDTHEVKALVEQIFGQLPAGEAALQTPPQPAPLVGSQNVEEFRPKAQAILMVGYHGADMFSNDRYALELIDEASSDLGSRFFVRIRENLGLAYFVGSSQIAGLVSGPFVFYLGTDPMKLQAVKAELLDEISQLADQGLTPEELARAKEKLLGQQDMRNQSNDSFAYACALDELYGLGYDDYKHLRERIEKVTVEEVTAIAQKYFKNKPSVVAVVRPESKE
jgi:zinc protease